MASTYVALVNGLGSAFLTGGKKSQALLSAPGAARVGGGVATPKRLIVVAAAAPKKSWLPGVRGGGNFVDPEWLDEVRAYFHREEAIRYLIPDRVFHYTALDDKKSAVAPFRRNSNKSVTKSRGHYIFKPNRPPQFSLLSLIRDAAARLPSSLGTRADICILVRDSPYIVDNIPEKTVKRIVSGALDRLQCEPDPCVEYNGKWGLWV